MISNFNQRATVAWLSVSTSDSLDGCVYGVNMDTSDFISSDPPTANISALSPSNSITCPPSLEQDVIEYNDWLVFEEELITNST
jgi:hypothetical protein